MSDLFGLWPHQDEAIKKIEEAWKGGYKSICYQLPTGGGKSRVIRQIVDNHANNKKVIYIISHRRQLLRQLSDEITEAGITHGIIASGYPQIRYRVQVCSIATLKNRKENMPEPDVIIIDEFHHIKAESYLSTLQYWSNAKLLGVTATPRRTDGSPLSDVCQHLIVGPAMRDLIDNNYLSDYEYYAPATISMQGVKKNAGEFSKKETEARVDKTFITGSAVEHYKKYADHLPAIASCVSIAHADHVAEQFRIAGYKAKSVHSHMKQEEINQAIAGLRNGTLEVLCQCEMLGEGIDIKGAVCLIGLRPTASEIVYLQHVGRVLRKCDGKKNAVILDHVGNWERHGLPDWDREWSLDGKTKTDTGESCLKRCPECLHIVNKTERQCPYCGFLWAEREEKGEKIPEEKEGELVSVKNIEKSDRNELIIKIARGARTLKQAIKIAKLNGVDHRGAYYIWCFVLKNKR